jgi:hypothetical protein
MTLKTLPRSFKAKPANMDTFELSNLISDGVNVVELYLTPHRLNSADQDNVRVGRNGVNAITVPPKWNLIHKAPMKVYYHRDMMYLYDLSNDAQKAVREIYQKHGFFDQYYALSYQEEVLPIHRFPVTKELTHETKIIRQIYRINNRISLYLDYDEVDNISYTYLHYNHAANVDLVKMNEDMVIAMKKLMQSHRK